MIETSHLNGVLAAAGTAFCWGTAAVFFSSAARRMGQFHVNQIRLVMAVLLLAASAAAMGLFGAPLPANQMALLAVSGFSGLVIGDSAYFVCLAILGPRRGILLLSLAPAFTAAMAVPMLGEPLNATALIGMAVTLAGSLWVAIEQGAPGEMHGNPWAGIGFGIIGAVGQAFGAVLAKAGLGYVDTATSVAQVARLVEPVAIHPLIGTLVRMVAGGLVLVALGLARGSAPQTLGKLSDRHGMMLTLGGTFFGPFIGVTLSLFALTQTDAAVAATIFATAPVVVIPLVVVLYKQKVSVRAVAGAIVAIAGVAILAFKDQIRF
ncbi:MAG: DMT family transporter [Planctomycetes bacterium]|nr:DMT family transporter [Planctomycetota bacterium]